MKKEKMVDSCVDLGFTSFYASNAINNEDVKKAYVNNSRLRFMTGVEL